MSNADRNNHVYRVVGSLQPETDQDGFSKKHLFYSEVPIGAVVVSTGIITEHGLPSYADEWAFFDEGHPLPDEWIHAKHGELGVVIGCDNEEKMILVYFLRTRTSTTVTTSQVQITPEQLTGRSLKDLIDRVSLVPTSTSS
jgi:hypothetical protein